MLYTILWYYTRSVCRKIVFSKNRVNYVQAFCIKNNFTTSRLEEGGLVSYGDITSCINLAGCRTFFCLDLVKINRFRPKKTSTPAHSRYANTHCLDARSKTGCSSADAVNSSLASKFSDYYFTFIICFIADAIFTQLSLLL